MFHGKITPEAALGLKELQKRIAAANIPSSKLDETLNIASWNIREFGKKETPPGIPPLHRGDHRPIRPRLHRRAA